MHRDPQLTTTRTLYIDTTPTEDTPVQHRTRTDDQFTAYWKDVVRFNPEALQGIIDQLSYGKRKTARTPRPISYPVKIARND